MCACAGRRVFQLALLATSMAVAPCSCPGFGPAPAGVDTSLDADLHFALYAGGLDGFGQQPSFPMGDVGLQQGHQHMFAHREHPDFEILQDHSFISQHEERNAAMTDQVHHNPVFPFQDHTHVLHGITNHNVSPIQGYTFPQILNSAAHKGHSHAGNPFSIDENSQLVPTSNQNMPIQVQEQTTPAILHETSHSTLPDKCESDIFHEIVEVIDSPGYDVLDPRQIHHNQFLGLEPQVNPIKSTQNVQGIDSARFCSLEAPQENSRNAQLIQGQEQLVPVHGLAQLLVDPYRQETPPVPFCVSARHDAAVQVQGVGGEKRVNAVSGTDAGRAMSPVTTRSAQILEDDEYSRILTNIPLENQIPRDGEVIPNIDISPVKNIPHCIHCSGNVVNDGQPFWREHYQEVKSDMPGSVKTQQYRPFPGESVNHQKQSFSTFLENDHCQRTFSSFPVPPKDSQISIRQPENVQREAQNILNHQSLTFQDSQKSIQQLKNVQREAQNILNHKYLTFQDSQISIQQPENVQRETQNILNHKSLTFQDSQKSIQQPENVQREAQNILNHKFFNFQDSQKSIRQPENVQREAHNILNHQSLTFQDSQKSTQQPENVQREAQNILNHKSSTFQDSQKTIRQPENVQREAQNIVNHQSSTFPMITDMVSIPIGIEQERVSDFKLPRESDEQLQPTNYHVQPLVHERADAQESPSSVTRRELNTCSNNFQQHPILPKRYSQFKKDINYLPSLKSASGNREKAMTYQKIIRSNVPEPRKMPSTLVPVATRDVPPRRPVAESPLAPRQPIQAPGVEPLLIAVPPEEFTVPPTLSEIPYDAFPYSESTDAEAKPTDSDWTLDDSADCGNARFENSARCNVSNATRPVNDAGTNGLRDEPAGTAPPVVDGGATPVLKVTEDVKIRRNLTEGGERNEIKKKAKKRYETSLSNRTTTGKEKNCAVTTVSRLEAAGVGGGGESNAAVQLCRCEPGKGCTCQCVKGLCRAVGLRVAEDVGEFVKKEAVSVLKTIRDLKISA